MDGDTIAALSTPLGRGGIAVIRISGPDALPSMRRVVDGPPSKLKPRRLYHGFIQDNGRHIDECMAVFFKGPDSYTGEDSVEISIHSNPFIIEEVLNLLLKQKDLSSPIRTAMAGEFTYRAFKHGKMDLVQAESVNELINANSRYYAHMTFGTLEGKLSRFMTELKEQLINLGVQVETKIEFEEDQYFDEIALDRHLEAPLKRLDTLLTSARFNDLLNRGLHVVIAGKVNVGKSSLFNTLLMEERSIISSVPGTTRDFIKEKLYIDGFPIDITDVAGINRDTDDEIEAQGIERSLQKIRDCDAVIFMLDHSRPLEESDREIYRLVEGKKKLVVVNKTDLPDSAARLSLDGLAPDERVVEVSVKEHRNIDAVLSFLKELIAGVTEKESDYTVNQRQKSILEELREVLLHTRKMMVPGSGHAEIAAEEIRRALSLIGQLMGEVTPDDILNQIFSQFCVGK